MKTIAVLMMSASLFAACGGAGSNANHPALSCGSAEPYRGAALHTALSADSFPAPRTTPSTNVVMPDELGSLLDARVKEILLQTGAPAVAVALDVHGLGRWASTQGTARAVPLQPASEATLFYWGSVAKSLTAVVVLQLVDEGKLDPNDTLARWYPQMPQAEHITIKHLLTHTSGLATNAGDPLGPVALSAADLLMLASKTPNVFCPGTDVNYSNTAYRILAMIVEAIEQQPFDQVLKHRISEPLGLKQLRALGPGEEQPAGFATPHRGREPRPDPGAWGRVGAGNVFATADDMLSFWQALLTGRLLPPAMVRQQWGQLYPLGDGGQAALWYGQGVMLLEWTDEQGRTRNWLAHLGGIPTANAAVAYDPSTGAYIVAAVNSEVSSTAVAHGLLQVIATWRSAH